MKETGIIMSGEHPRKILDGKKTMTRRTYGLEKINDMPYLWGEPHYDEEVGMWLFWQQNTGDCIHIKCPYGYIGDRLWVRETWWKDQSGGCWGYKADGIEWPPLNCGGKAMPSIFMPRWASRITLEITELRPERLQEICWEDCQDEGIKLDTLYLPEELALATAEYISDFIILWDSLNAKRGYGWDKNPWVWVIGWPKLSFENT